MFKPVENTCRHIDIEHEVLQWWQQSDAFETLRRKNAGSGKRFSFLDGPITANNPMGVHHAWGRTLKDAYQRYNAMLGKECRYQNGFDCQGLWVEIEVEKQLGFKSKREVQDYGVENFVEQCKQRVRKYSAVQSEQSIRLGYWMDWDNSYYTMSDENNYTIWSFLKKLFEQGKLYRGSDVVPWSGRSGTSYSQMEIIEGRKLVAHDAIFVRFPLKGRDNEYLLVWTTTPWTLTSNVAAAVNVSLGYVRLKAADGSVYYFAKENLDYKRLDKQYKDKKNWVEGVPKLKTLTQLFKERGGYEVLGTVKGAEMVGWEYEGPFDHLPAQQAPGGYPFTNAALKEQGLSGASCHRVIDGGKDPIGNDIVVAGEGTGIVHIAPGCGDIDHKIGKKQGLAVIAPLDEEARYIDGFGELTGQVVTDEATKQAIIEDLKAREILVYVEQYPHVYPHCWRSGDELVFRIVDEWYIRMDWRDRIKKNVDAIRWIPSWGREREHEWLDNMGDWMISKKRFWGLALPIWVFEDGSFYVVGSKEELQSLAVEGWDEFEGHSPHRPWIDRVKIKHPETGLIGTRIPDVGNPWLDAGIVPYSTVHYNTDRDYWKQWIPADLVLECFPGQFRNWFYALLAMSTVMEDIPPFKTLLGHALVRDEYGQEMHKSTGNAIWFDDAAEKMGADIMRWIYCGQNPSHNLNFGYGVGEHVNRRVFATWWNVYSFFVNYARLDGFDPARQAVPFTERQPIDQWLLSKLQVLIRTANEGMVEYDVARLIHAADDFIERLSNWYVRRCRRRFWRARSDSDIDKLSAYQTLYTVLVELTKVLAPVAPFITEHMYQNLIRSVDDSAPDSVHHCDYPQCDESMMVQGLAEDMDLVADVVSRVLGLREKRQMRVRQPLSRLIVCTADERSRSVLQRFQGHLLEELNIKSLAFDGSLRAYERISLKPNHKVLGPKHGSAMKAIVAVLTGLPQGDDDRGPGHENAGGLGSDAGTGAGSDADTGKGSGSDSGSGSDTAEVAVADATVVASSVEQVARAVREGRSFELTDGNDRWRLDPEDVVIESSWDDCYEISVEPEPGLVLDVELTDELKREGTARDIVRHLQQTRKDIGLEIQDRIRVDWHSEDGAIAEAMDHFGDYVCRETLCESLSRNEGLDGEHVRQLKIGGGTLAVTVAKDG